MSNENTKKFEIKLDPIDWHPELREQLEEFEYKIGQEMKNRAKTMAQKIEKQLKSRFCHCCFFGHVEGEVMGEPLCKECGRELYGITPDNDHWTHPSRRAFDLNYQLWYRKKKALPIFEAFLHAELGRWEAEQKLEEYMHGKGNKGDK